MKAGEEKKEEEGDKRQLFIYLFFEYYGWGRARGKLRGSSINAYSLLPYPFSLYFEVVVREVH